MIKLLILARSSDDEELVIPVSLRALGLPIVSIALLMAFQLVPLPQNTLRVLSPATYRLYEMTLPRWTPSSPAPVCRGKRRGRKRENASVIGRKRFGASGDRSRSRRRYPRRAC